MTITPEERATKLVSEDGWRWLIQSPDEHTALDKETAAEDIATAIREAVEAEREGCAKLAETLKTLSVWLPCNEDGSGENKHNTIHGIKIAKAIRARSNPTPEAE